MKSPNDLECGLAQRPRANPNVRSLASVEDARVQAARVELRIFVENITALIEKRLDQLSEKIFRGELALSETLAYSGLMKMIGEATAAEFQQDPAILYSPRKYEKFVVPRQTAMYLCRRLTDSSLAMIGDHFGGRDHGTVLHAMRATEDRMCADGRFKRAVETLEARLKQRLDAAPPKANQTPAPLFLALQK